MTVYYERDGLTLHCGDALAVLATLPAGSVQTCVTSPPYLGLRDYGTGQWEGGDLGCDHVAGMARGDTERETPGGRGGSFRGGTALFRDLCGKCGARRIDQQIGLEPTPAEYVAALVAVFREVRRVLRDDGVVFLNLGDSYYSNPGNGRGGGSRLSGGKPHLSGVPRVRACGSAGIVSQGLLDHGSSFESLDGEHRDSWWQHIAHTDCRHALAQVHESLQRIRARMAELRDHLPSEDCLRRLPSVRSLAATLDQVQTAVRAFERLHASLPSMPLESCPPPPAGFLLSDIVLACRSSLHAFAACARRCVDMSDDALGNSHCMVDNASLCEELAHHIRCTDGYCSLVASWLNPPYIQPQYTTLKAKDLIGIPWRVAFALQDDGWYLRSDIIWHKPNPMPESVTDRPTRCHEYIFLLAKQARYWYDADAIAERALQPLGTPALVAQHKRGTLQSLAASTLGANQGAATRNKRDVWTVATQPYDKAHFATFPQALIEPCILAGAPAGGVVLDPFAGAATAGLVAQKHGRRFIGIELNPEYCRLARERLAQVALPLSGEEAAG